nr:hypothetical protein [Anaerolineae bacterium]
TQEHFKAYPALLQRFRDLLAACTDPAILRRTLALDNGYYLLAGDRQQMLEKWLACERTPEVLRLYAMQLMLFGNVDAFGEADTNTDALVAALEQEADALEQQPPAPAAQPNPDPDRDRAAES